MKKLSAFLLIVTVVFCLPMIGFLEFARVYGRSLGTPVPSLQALTPLDPDGQSNV